MSSSKSFCLFTTYIDSENIFSDDKCDDSSCLSYNSDELSLVRKPRRTPNITISVIFIWMVRSWRTGPRPGGEIGPSSLLVTCLITFGSKSIQLRLRMARPAFWWSNLGRSTKSPKKTSEKVGRSTKLPKKTSTSVKKQNTLSRVTALESQNTMLKHALKALREDCHGDKKKID